MPLAGNGLPHPPAARQPHLPAWPREVRRAFINEAFIVRPGEGRHVDLGNFEALVLASAAQTSGDFMLLQLQREPPDFGQPLHLPREAAEAFHVLVGKYLMYMEARQQHCPPRHLRLHALRP
jgi:hypothetical protein